MARYRSIPLLALGMLSLLVALWSGLMRMGWLPATRPDLAALHGPLMISGFLGTLISLERAVALGRGWTFAAPLLVGLGALSFLAGVPGTPGPFLITAGSLGLVTIFATLVRLQPALFTATMAAGALLWLSGNVLWLAGSPIYRLVFWWAGFLVLTIVGERLELSRLLRLPAASQAAFLAAAGLFVAGIVLSVPAFDAGVRLAGAGMIALTLWLARHDIARRTVRQGGLTRFISVSLLSGYVWLGVSGMLALSFGGQVAGPRYDAMLHALFLGFVIAMVFGHAPVIFPAVLRRTMSYRPTFYAHLVLLHVTLLLRVAGDLTGWLPGRRWGGLLNVAVMLLFLANTVYAIVKPAASSQEHKS